MIDSHCHLTNDRFAADRCDVIARMAAADVSGCITIGTGCDDAAAALALASAHPGRIWATAGLDPFSAHACGGGFDAELARLQALLCAGGFVALGEIGIECHHQLDPLPIQCERTAAQLALAARLGLPVVLHARSGRNGGDAHAHLLDLVRQQPGLRGVVHSFDGGAAQARAWLDAGMHLAVNGMVTFTANQALRDAVRLVPDDRLLVETDAPYLAPVPLRGRRNEPAWVAKTMACIAEVRGEREADLSAWNERTTRALFSLPPRDQPVS